MALTQVSTDGVKDGTITGTDLTTNVDFVDNQKLRIGTGNDLQIYHNSGFNIFANTNSSQTVFRSDNFFINNQANDENLAKFLVNGAVELYYDNSKKFETNTYGALVSGSLFTTAHVYFGNQTSDNCKAFFGAGNDLQIYHDSANSLIDEVGTGILGLRSDTGINLYKLTGNEFMLKAIPDGAVELYHDNTKRLETTSWGASLTGTLVASSNIKTASDTGKLMAGASDDLQLFHDGSNSFIKDGGGSTGLVIQAPLLAVKNAAGSENMIVATENGNVELMYDNSKKFETTSSGVTVTGNVVATGNMQVNDNNFLYVGNSGDLEIRHNATGGRNEIKSLNHDFLLLSNDSIHFQVFASGNTNNQAILTLQNTGITSYRDIRVDKGSTGSDGLLGEAYGGYFGLKHADQTLSSEYMMISNDSHTYISCSSGSSIYLRPSANSSAHETIFAHDTTTFKTNIYMNGHNIIRSDFGTGFLIGAQNNQGASDAKTNPIFSIGTSHIPTNTALSDMYGIGFSHGNASFTPTGAGWGLYACADGDARIYLDASLGRIYLDSTLDSNNTDPMYLAPTTGNYGSIQINGGTTGGWLGYSIAAGAVFMYNGSIAGIFNDIENEWFAYGNRNGQWRTFYNGIQKTNTSDTGLTVIGTVNETSDIALKENIQPLTNALENLKKLKGYSYNFIDNKAKALGIVAQDVEKVYPDIVEGEEGEKSVAYSGLIAVLIEAVKELETEVAALKAS